MNTQMQHKMIHKVGSLFDRFIHPTLLQDLKKRYRARFMVGQSFISITMLTLFLCLPLDIYHPKWISKVILTFFIFASLGSIASLARLGKLKLAASILPSLFLLITPYDFYQSGGLHAGSIYWIATAQVTTSYLISVRWGLYFAFAITLEVLIYLALMKMGIAPTSIAHVNVLQVPIAILSTSSAFSLSWLLYLGNYEREQLFKKMEHTDREARQELQIAEERNSTIVQNMRDGLFIIDMEGNILKCNRAAEKIFGYPIEELLGSSIDVVLPRLIKSNAFKTNSSLSYPGLQNHYPWKALQKRGGIKPVEIRASLLRLTTGFCYAIYIQDFTERKQLGEMQDNFVSVVSHELRTPMTSILGSLQLISGGVLGKVDPNVKSMVDMAIRNSERLTRLLNDLLDIQKLNTNKLSLRKESLRIDLFLQQAIKDCQGYSERYDVKIVLKHPLAANHILGDKDRITQVFLNLVSNAAKHTPKGMKVQIFTVSKKKRIRICIQDQGSGVGSQFSKKIFTKFQQADNSSTRQNEGTGLGLAISKAIIEHHGGRIGYKNSKEGGAIFWFEFDKVDHLLQSGSHST